MAEGCRASLRESSQVLHDGLALRKKPLFLGFRRFVMSPDVRAIQKSHSECQSVLSLNPFGQAFPYVEFCPADEKLCRSPSRAQFSGDALPFRAILMAPQNPCYYMVLLFFRKFNVLTFNLWLYGFFRLAGSGWYRASVEVFVLFRVKGDIADHLAGMVHAKTVRDLLHPHARRLATYSIHARYG